MGAEDPRRRCRRCRSCATSPPTSRPTAPRWSSTIDRDTASRYGITAAADRRHALRRVRPAPGGAVFHAAQQLPRDPGGAAGAAGQPRHAEQDLREIADDRRAGAAVDLRQVDHACRCGRCRSAIRASFRRSPSASTSRRAWRWDRRPTRCRRRWSNSARRRRSIRQLPGHRAGVPAVARHRAAADPGGARRRLPDPRHSLRKLHPPAHDPVDAAVGRRRCARDPDAVRLRLQPDRADRHHPADRHRQEERHHDGRLRDHGRARRAS